MNREALLTQLGNRAQNQLAELEKQLTHLLGRNLRALVVHGSAARGDYKEGTSDVDLIVVLTEASAEALRAMSNPLRLASAAARIEAMILVEQEIAHTTDVFPLFYRDIQECHVALHGTSPFANLSIHPEHLRLRIEQELRDSQIRLRRAIVDAPEAFVGALLRKTKQIRPALRALLQLRGVAVANDVSAVLRAAGSHFGVDASPIFSAKEDPARAYATFVKLLDCAISAVDSMEKA